MSEELDRLAQLAAEYREIGCDVVEVADLMVSRHPHLKESPLDLARILKQVFGVSVRDLHAVAAWVRGDMSQDELKKFLNTAE